MSRIEIGNVTHDGMVERYDDSPRNAFGGAFHIWKALSTKYDIPFDLFTGDGKLDCWKPENLARMTEDERWVMMSTFDTPIVRKEHLSRLIQALTAFVKLYPTATLQTEIEVLQRAAHDPDVVGVCWNQTSVNSAWWDLGYDDRGEPIRYNVNKQTTHWYLTPTEVAGGGEL